MKPGGCLLKFWFVTGCFLLAIAGVWTRGASAGYLRTVGPAPLRFRSPPVIQVSPQIAVLQQETEIKPSDQTSETPVQPPDSLLPAVAIPQVANPNGESLLPPVLPNPRPTDAPAPANELLVINPQMLIEYFKAQPGSTNAPLTAIVPVQFTPATPAVVPGSRAIYKTE